LIIQGGLFLWGRSKLILCIEDKQIEQSWGLGAICSRQRTWHNPSIMQT